MSIRIGIGIKPAGVTTIPSPSGLTLTLISAGVKIDWTDNSGGTAQTEIWVQNDGGVSALLYTINAGTVTKNDDAVAPVDLRYYKIRALEGGNYSAFTAEESIAMLGPECNSDVEFNNPLSWGYVGTNVIIAGGKCVSLNGNPALDIIWNIPTGSVTIGKTYRIKGTSSGYVAGNLSILLGGGSISYEFASNIIDKIGYHVCAGDTYIYIAPKLNPTTVDIENLSVKEVLFP